MCNAIVYHLPDLQLYLPSKSGRVAPSRGSDSQSPLRNKKFSSPSKRTPPAPFHAGLIAQLVQFLLQLPTTILHDGINPRRENGRHLVPKLGCMWDAKNSFCPQPIGHIGPVEASR
ncbi:MAG: hypothetical protein RB191_18455 [Terriglobia bacterium]|nr:hypothetical protein [Terriglobia bacterium]